MKRRTFVMASSAAALASAASGETATVLYSDRSTTLNDFETRGADLWVRRADLPRIDDFELKPEGACRADLCIPVSKDLTRGNLFNLSGFARKIGEASVNEGGVWSFGEIPVLRGAFLESRVAPDFAVPDRKGKIVHLSDFRDKKVLVVTWASW